VHVTPVTFFLNPEHKHDTNRWGLQQFKGTRNLMAKTELVRVEIKVDRMLDASASLVWSMIGNWEWWAFGPAVLDEDNKNIRYLSEGKITEVLTHRDDDARQIKYKMTKNPFGVVSYTGEINVDRINEKTKTSYIAVAMVPKKIEKKFRAQFKASLEQGLERLDQVTSGKGEVVFIIGAPLERLWTAISNWHDVSWVKGVVRAKMLSPHVRRQYFENDVYVDSALSSIDLENHTVTYKVIETPVALSFYRASITLEELGPEHTRWRYSYEFAPAPLTSSKEIGNYLKQNLVGRSKWLQGKFETRIYGDPKPSKFRCYILSGIGILSLL